MIILKIFHFVFRSESLKSLKKSLPEQPKRLQSHQKLELIYALFDI